MKAWMETWTLEISLSQMGSKKSIWFVPRDFVNWATPGTDDMIQDLINFASELNSQF